MPNKFKEYITILKIKKKVVTIRKIDKDEDDEEYWDYEDEGQSMEELEKLEKLEQLTKSFDKQKLLFKDWKKKALNYKINI